MNTLLIILIGIVYVGVAIFVYWLTATKTDLQPECAMDVMTVIWLAMVWPLSIIALPAAMIDFKNKDK